MSQLRTGNSCITATNANMQNQKSQYNSQGIAQASAFVAAVVRDDADDAEDNPCLSALLQPIRNGPLPILTIVYGANARNNRFVTRANQELALLDDNPCHVLFEARKQSRAFAQAAGMMLKGQTPPRFFCPVRKAAPLRVQKSRMRSPVEYLTCPCAVNSITRPVSMSVGRPSITGGLNFHWPSAFSMLAR